VPPREAYKAWPYRGRGVWPGVTLPRSVHAEFHLPCCTWAWFRQALQNQQVSRPLRGAADTYPFTVRRSDRSPAGRGFLHGDLLDYLFSQEADLDVGSLRRPAHQVERFVRAALVLRHQDALGLLDDRHGLQPGLQPGERGVVQYLPLGPTALDPVEGRLQSCPDVLEPPRLGLELQSRCVQPAKDLRQGITGTWVHADEAIRRTPLLTGLLGLNRPRPGG